MENKTPTGVWLFLHLNRDDSELATKNDLELKLLHRKLL